MSSPFTVKIPLLNANEPETLLATVYVSEGQQVSRGDTICTLETTKSTADLEAETSGYVVGLQYREGQTILAGEILCYLSESPDWTPIESKQTGAENEPPGERPAGLRITQPALNLAREHNLDLEELPTGPLITEKEIKIRLQDKAEMDQLPTDNTFDPTAIIVYGGGGHGKSLVDLLRSLGTYQIIGFVDDGLDPGEKVMGLPVLGGGEVLSDIYSQGIRLAVNAVGGIGNLKIRKDVFHRLARAGFVCPAVVHPSAVVEPSATLSPGVQVFTQAYVGSESRIGFGTIINTGAIVSHDCVLGDYVNISPGAILAGMVQVRDSALVGMGATINLEVKIGEQARIGNGATVKSDLPANLIVRAGTIWPAE
jgi:acetyltransferase EpsM